MSGMGIMQNIAWLQYMVKEVTAAVEVYTVTAFLCFKSPDVHTILCMLTA